jgi:hypothetical protein
MQAQESAAKDRRVSIAEIACVVGLCVLALVLRLRGIGYLLPVMPLSDGIHIVRQVDVLRGKQDVASKEKFFYPQLLPRLTTLLPDAGRTHATPATPLAEHVLMGREPWRQVRIVSALLSVLIVPGTWLLARKFLRGPWPLFAASLVTTSLLHTSFSSQEKPHGMLAAFLVLSVVAAIRVRERGDVASYALFGVCAGLAIGSIHSGATVLALFPAIFLWRDKHSARTSQWWLLLPLAMVALSVWLCYPQLIAGQKAPPPPPNPGAPGKVILDVSGHLVSLDRFRGGGFRVILDALCSYDPVLLVLTAIGAVVAALELARRRFVLDERHRKNLAIALSFALPYFVIVGLYDLSLERFVLPLLPYFACVAAYGVGRVLAAKPAWSALPAAAGVFPALALVPAWHLGTVRAAPDTFARTAACVAEHARPSSDRIVIIPALDLPLLHDEESLRENAKHPLRSNWVRYQMQLDPSERTGPEFGVYVSPKSVADAQRELEADPMQYFRGLGAQYVVLAVDSDPAQFLSRVRRVVAENAELVCRETPEARDEHDGTNFLYRYQVNPWKYPFFCFVMHMKCTGETLEVYRLR